MLTLSLREVAAWWYSLTVLSKSTFDSGRACSKCLHREDCLLCGYLCLSLTLSLCYSHCASQYASATLTVPLLLTTIQQCTTMQQLHYNAHWDSHSKFVHADLTIAVLVYLQTNSEHRSVMVRCIIVGAMKQCTFVWLHDAFMLSCIHQRWLAFRVIVELHTLVLTSISCCWAATAQILEKHHKDTTTKPPDYHYNSLDYHTASW